MSTKNGWTQICLKPRLRLLSVTSKSVGPPSVQKVCPGCSNSFDESECSKCVTALCDTCIVSSEDSPAVLFCSIKCKEGSNEEIAMGVAVQRSQNEEKQGEEDSQSQTY